MKRVLLKLLAWAGGAALLVGVLGLAAYFTFSASVRRGGVPAPDVLGLGLEDAQRLAEESGLSLRHRSQEDRFDDTTPKDAVVQQDPPPGNPMKRGGSLAVVLSKGQQLVLVPDVRGQAMQAVQTELAAAGLLPGRVSRVFWPDGAPNTVVHQEPGPQVEAARGSNVDLLVAIEDPGAAFVMPDLVSRRAAIVQERFERAGFRFGSVKYEPYEGVEPGVVLRHTPLPGHPLRRHDSITLVVAAESGG